MTAPLPAAVVASCVWRSCLAASAALAAVGCGGTADSDKFGAPFHPHIRLWSPAGAPSVPASADAPGPVPPTDPDAPKPTDLPKSGEAPAPKPDSDAAESSPPPPVERRLLMSALDSAGYRGDLYEALRIDVQG
jgi:hypothetical protein